LADHLKLLLSCEHGGNLVPEPYRALFEGHAELLQTHRGFDIGILPLAKQLAEHLNAPLEFAEVSRLLVDLNRSLRHPALFSFITRELSRAEKDTLLQGHYHPYRQAAETQICRLIEDGHRVVHVAVHSFTPELHGQVRNADIGLLYDPTRPLEKTFCLRWQQALADLEPGLRIRRNYPYQGAADSLGKTLRRRFAANEYLAIELEVNQKIPIAGGEAWRQLSSTLTSSLSQALGGR